MKRHFVWSGFWLIVALTYCFEARAIDINWFYTDQQGQGFFDPVLGAQRRAAMQAGADIIGHFLRPTYFGEAMTIQVNSYYDASSNTLASAAPNFFYGNFGSSDPRYQTDTHYPKPLADSLAGHELDVGHIDAHINVNLAQSFYLGTDANPPAAQTDLVSVAVHEVMHCLGFDDSFRQQGGYGVFGDNTYDSDTGVSGFPKIYDRFVSYGTSPVIAIGSSDTRAAALVSNNLFWNGSNGAASNGGSPPKLDAHSPFDPAVNVAHLDINAFPTDIIAEGIAPGQVKQTVSSVDRGMYRDMGWNVSVFPSNVTWTAGGGNNLSSNNSNWSQAPYPGDNLTFSTNAANVYDVKMDAALYQYGEIHFTATAPAYTLRMRSYTDTDLTNFGVRNDGVSSHTIILETYADDLANGTAQQIYFGRAATLNFKNNATSENSIFQVEGGSADIDRDPNSTWHYKLFNGSEMNLSNGSTASNSTFTVQGSSGGSAASPGLVEFHNLADAGTATITNQAGRSGTAIDQFNNVTIAAGFGGLTNFHDQSTAWFSHITNQGQDQGPAGTGTGGITNFYDTATAGGATIDNLGATYTTGQNTLGGRTQFQNSSSANQATIINHGGLVSYNGPPFANVGGGTTTFSNTSTAGNATIENLPAQAYGQSPGFTLFANSSNAGTATINNRGADPGYFPGFTSFRDSSSAASASIHCFPSLYGHTPILDFYDNSTAGSSNISFDIAGGYTYPFAGQLQFHNNSTAASSTITVHGPNAVGDMLFHDNSSGGSSHIIIEPTVNSYDIQFLDNATAANSTISGGSHTYVYFYTNATAANANITAQTFIFGGNNNAANNPTVFAGQAVIHVVPDSATYGGSAGFGAWTSADNATITVDGQTDTAAASSVYFSGLSTAGHAMIILNSPTTNAVGAIGGIAQFFTGSSADNARLITNAASQVLLQNSAALSIGSIEGAGTVNLQYCSLTVGGLGLSTVISGPIIDLNPGGSLTKIGAGTLTLAGTNTYQGLTTVNAGTLRITGSIPGDAVVDNGATLNGTGTIGGTVTVNPGGIFAPGTSPGTITVGGLTMTHGSALSFELGNPRDHIVLTNNGNLSIAGTLNISLVGGFVPSLGQSFPLFEGTIGSITGAFDAITAPIFNGMTFDVHRTTNSVLLQVGEAGDFNGDGRVDSADYVTWRKGLGTTYTQSDYNAWRAHFGQAAGRDIGAGAAVPEPTATVLLLFTMVGMPRRRRTAGLPVSKLVRAYDTPRNDRFRHRSLVSRTHAFYGTSLAFQKLISALGLTLAGRSENETFRQTNVSETCVSRLTSPVSATKIR